MDSYETCQNGLSQYQPPNTSNQTGLQVKCERRLKKIQSPYNQNKASMCMSKSRKKLQIFSLFTKNHLTREYPKLTVWSYHQRKKERKKKKDCMTFWILNDNATWQFIKAQNHSWFLVMRYICTKGNVKYQNNVLKNWVFVSLTSPSLLMLPFLRPYFGLRFIHLIILLPLPTMITVSRAL